MPKCRRRQLSTENNEEHEVEGARFESEPENATGK